MTQYTRVVNYFFYFFHVNRLRLVICYAILGARFGANPFGGFPIHKKNGGFPTRYRTGQNGAEDPPNYPTEASCWLSSIPACPVSPPPPSFLFFSLSIRLPNPTEINSQKKSESSPPSPRANPSFTRARSNPFDEKFSFIASASPSLFAARYEALAPPVW